MRLNNFLNEAIKMKAKNADWYINPEMVGHTWAAEMVDKLEDFIKKYGRTKLQKALIKICAPIDSDDWHSFSQYSKKYLSRLQYVVRRIDKKGNKLQLLKHDKSGMAKDHLVWILEYMAWIEDPDSFCDYYAGVYQFYGMDREEALKRASDYIKGLYNRHLKKIFQEKKISETIFK